jgi:hypothetical protein
VIARYDDQYTEDGRFYSVDTGWFEIRAPDGSEAILDLTNGVEFPEGWNVSKKWKMICDVYTITAPNGDVMTFADSWNA